MKRETIIKETEFELECSRKQAEAIYTHYKKLGQLDTLIHNLKYHKEIPYGICKIQ